MTLSVIRQCTRVFYLTLCCYAAIQLSINTAYAQSSSQIDCSLADLDGDGIVDIFDVSHFIASFSSSSNGVDINGDGQFNVFDLLSAMDCFFNGYRVPQNDGTCVERERVDGLDVRAFIDGQLVEPCLEGSYSICERDCSGSDGDAYPVIQDIRSIAAPGDRILLRQHVHRETGFDGGSRGLMTTSLGLQGTAEQPIRIEAFPEEDPVLDGRTSIDSSMWQQCQSAAHCPGIDAYPNVYVAELSVPFDSREIALYDGDHRIYLAQEPEPYEGNSNYFDRPHDRWHLVPAERFTMSSLTVPEEVRALYQHINLQGLELMLNTGNNTTYFRDILSFNSTTGEIGYGNVADPAVLDRLPNFLDPGFDRFALRDHPSFLDSPGEFYIDAAANRIYYFPLEGEIELSFSQRAYGIQLIGAQHLHIEGLTLKGYRKHAIGNYFSDNPDNAVSDITIRDCEVSLVGDDAVRIYGSRITVEQSYIHDSSDAGIFISSGSENRILANLTERVAGTNLRFYSCENCEIIGNTVRDGHGQHANGITAYLQSNNVVIADNTVYNANIPLTVKQSANISIHGNVFVSDFYAIAAWNTPQSDPNVYGNILMENNTVIRLDNKMPLAIGDRLENVIANNNIVVGADELPQTAEGDDNLFVRVPEMNSLFTDMSDMDFSIQCPGDYEFACTMTEEGSFVGALECY